MQNLSNQRMFSRDPHTEWQFSAPTIRALLYRATAWLHSRSCTLVASYYREAVEDHRALVNLLGVEAEPK
jgi:hypothetical protein